MIPQSQLESSSVFNPLSVTAGKSRLIFYLNFYVPVTAFGTCYDIVKDL